MNGTTRMDNTLDATAAAAAITSPVWLEYVDKGLTTYMVAAGAVLLTLRCLKTFRDWLSARQMYAITKEKRQEEKADE